MKPLVLGFAGAAIVMLALDMLWLSTMAGLLYRPLIGEILLPDFRPVPAFLFYGLYLCGVVWFAVRPGLATRSIAAAALNGALFGLFAYGTYDLTNQATLKVWSTLITVADMGWGACLSAAAASAGTWLALRFGN